MYNVLVGTTAEIDLSNSEIFPVFKMVNTMFDKFRVMSLNPNQTNLNQTKERVRIRASVN